MHVFTMHSVQYALSMIKAIGILDFRKTSGFPSKLFADYSTHFTISDENFTTKKYMCVVCVCVCVYRAYWTKKSNVL